MKNDTMIEVLEIAMLAFITCGLSSLIKPNYSPTAGQWFINGFGSLGHLPA